LLIGFGDRQPGRFLGLSHRQPEGGDDRGEKQSHLHDRSSLNAREFPELGLATRKVAPDRAASNSRARKVSFLATWNAGGIGDPGEVTADRTNGIGGDPPMRK
jgi:hypothetical protein